MSRTLWPPVTSVGGTTTGVRRMSRAKYVVSVLSAVVVASLAPVSASASATSSQAPASARPSGCVTDHSFKIVGWKKGWSKTDVASEWTAGPATISRSESKTTTDTIGGSAGIKVSLSAVLASAEATVSVNYSRATSKTSTFQYTFNIPANRTGRAVRLHRADRIRIRQMTEHPNCGVSFSYHYVYLPLAGTTPGYYCNIRDLTPAMGRWQQYCTNSD